MNDLEIGYLAGLIDGEGSILIVKKGGQTVRVVSTDLDIIERAHAYSGGLGTISGPYEYKGRKPHWYWLVCDIDEVELLITSVYPHMCQRRKQAIDSVLDYIKSRRESKHRNCLTCGKSVKPEKRRPRSYCSTNCWKINYDKGIRVNG